MASPSATPLGQAPMSDELDLSESAAGEEDPGASIDMTPTPPGTGKDVCPDCGGNGRSASGICPTCRGTGKASSGTGDA